MRKIILILLFLFAMASVMAIQPTLQTNKIFLKPFYINNMTQNLLNNYTVSTITPDGISQISSAIITLDAWINPTRIFNVWINRVQCNTANYSVSTTYAGAGRAVITFDCSNAILPMRNNLVTITVTGGNIGASTAWLDLTYMNNPKGALSFSGTEYQPNDNGTVFLQLLDNNQQPINTSICYLTIYSPNKIKILNGGTMMYLLTSEGLYYYDFTVPNITGVYMLSARCFYYYNITYVTDIKDSYVISSAPTTNYGNYTYFVVGQASTAKMNSYIEFNLSNISGINNIEEVSLYLYVSSKMGDPIINIFRVTSSWDELNITWNNSPTINTFIYDSKTAINGWNQWNITSLAKSWLNGTFTNYGIFLNATSSTATWNFSTFSSRENSVELSPRLLIRYKTLEQINDIRGDGEVHVSDLPLTIWAYTNRTLTSNITVDNSAVAIAVWNYSVRNLTYYQNFSMSQQDLTNYSRISNLTAQDVWEYNNRNLTYYPPVNVSGINISVSIDNDAVAAAVWNYTTRNLTFYPSQEDLTNYSLIGDNVWSYTGNISDSILNYLESGVWSYGARYTHGVILN